MNLADKLEKIKAKYDSINEQLSNPQIAGDREKYVTLGRERSELQEIMEVYSKYASVLKNIEGNKEIVDTVDDKELVSMAEAELEELEIEQEKLEEEIKVLLLPKDPNDDKDIIMEIRAGTGGEEHREPAGGDSGPDAGRGHRRLSVWRRFRMPGQYPYHGSRCP